MKKYYKITTVHPPRTYSSIEHWSYDKITPKSKIIKNKDGTFGIQIDTSTLGNHTHPTELLRDYQIPKNDTYIGEAKLYKSAKLTDFISGSIFNQALPCSCFLMTQKSIQIFKNFNLGNYGIYPFEVKHKKKITNDYALLAFNGNATSDIDYKNSDFVILRGRVNTTVEKINIDTEEQFVKLRENKIVKLDGLTDRIFYSKLILKKDFNLDLFSFQYHPFQGIFASEKLINTIKNNDLTGFKIKETDIIQL